MDHSLEINLIPRVEICATKVRKWMDHMQLKMNDGKTESISFSSRRQLLKTIMKHLTINCKEIRLY